MYLKLVLTGCILAFIAVVLSAYVRLADAGLGCADWPACYQSNALKERQSLQANANQGYTTWQRKLHSQVVMLMGFLSVAISGLAWLKRKELRQSPLLPSLLTGLMVFLAVFGIWAFSHLPRAIIVPVHLGGGMLMLIMLLWMLLRQRPHAHGIDSNHVRQWQFFSRLGLALVIMQSLLGGWASANFAGIACTDFPLCNGHLMPQMDFSYTLGNPGEPLAETRLIAIHWLHRLGAIISLAYLIWLSATIMAHDKTKMIGIIILGLVVVQCALGASNVLLGLPLAGAVLHNAVAMMLIAALVWLNFRLQYGAHHNV